MPGFFSPLIYVLWEGHWRPLRDRPALPVFSTRDMVRQRNDFKRLGPLSANLGAGIRDQSHGEIWMEVLLHLEKKKKKETRPGFVQPR